MSHFTVLVVGPNPEKQLAPYHEFECTGVNDEYVQDIDITEQMLQEWSTDTKTMLVDPSGKLWDPYNFQFYRDPTKEEVEKHGPFLGGTGFGGGISYTSRDWKDGKGHRTKVRDIPDGYTEVEKKVPDLQSFRDWLTDQVGSFLNLWETPDLDRGEKFGYALLDKRGDILQVIKRTNPNKKWDWYVLGGRWEGYFIKKGTLERRPQLLKKEVAVDIMRYRAGNDLATRRARVAEIVGSYPNWEPWDSILKREAAKGVEKAREVYWGQSQLSKLKEERERWTYEDKLTDDDLTGDDAVKRAEDQALATFAVIKDGQWYQRGEMGWFGASTDEMPYSEWVKWFNQMWDALPGDVPVAVYDCHI